MLAPLIGALVMAVFIGVNVHQQDLKQQEVMKQNYEQQLTSQKKLAAKIQMKKKVVHLDGVEVASIKEGYDEA